MATVLPTSSTCTRASVLRVTRGKGAVLPSSQMHRPPQQKRPHVGNCITFLRTEEYLVEVGGVSHVSIKLQPRVDVEMSFLLALSRIQCSDVVTPLLSCLKKPCKSTPIPAVLCFGRFVTCVDKILCKQQG